MLTREEDVDAHALRRQGWTISAIARHLGRDRKTVRAYLNDERIAGERKSTGPDPFELFADYVRARLTEDPHLWAVTLFDEVVALGYDRSYPTFTRRIRDRGLRPHCEPCAGTKGRASTVIPHPPGEETQWDWLELPDPPEGWGSSAHLLVGSLAHSSKWRAQLAPAEDQAQLIAGLDAVARKLGGLSKTWRFDRMTTVCQPGSGKVTASFAAVAKHYGVSVTICPPRRGNRKGVVEKANHTAAQRCWRTLPDDATIEAAQAVFDTFAQARGDTRLRPAAGGKASVASVAAAEPLAPVPVAPFPATLTEQRVVSAQALVAWRGNFYSVPPELAHATVTVSQRLGTSIVQIATGSRMIIARHRAAPDGAGATVRDHDHVLALERLVLAGHDTRAPHRRKERIPPGPDARAAAQALRDRTKPTDPTNTRRCPGRGRPGQVRPRSPRKEHPAMTTTGSMPAPMTGSQASIYQQLRGHLAALNLTAAAEHLPSVLADAETQGWSMTATLEHLLAREVEATEARRLAGRLRFASLPTPATLADFDYDAAPAVDRKLVNELVTCRYLDTATNILLIGPPGVGKTHLAVGLGRAAAEAGYRTYFTTAADLAARCHRAAIEGRWATTMRFYAGPTLLASAASSADLISLGRKPFWLNPSRASDLYGMSADTRGRGWRELVAHGVLSVELSISPLTTTPQRTEFAISTRSTALGCGRPEFWPKTEAGAPTGQRHMQECSCTQQGCVGLKAPIPP